MMILNRLSNPLLEIENIAIATKAPAPAHAHARQLISFN